MKENLKKVIYVTVLSCLSVFLAPRIASATPVIVVHSGQVVALSSLMTAGDVVLCDPGISMCNANTPRADIEGVASFYLSFLGPFTPDTGPDANTVTFLTGSSLANFLNNYPGGFSSNAVFMDASASGNTPYLNFLFVDSSTSPAPEPSTLVLLGFGLLGLGFAVRRHLVGLSIAQVHNAKGAVAS